MVTILLIILAVAGITVVGSGSIERALCAVLPKLTGGRARWIGLVIEFLALWFVVHFIVAAIAAGAAIHLKACR